MLVEINLLPKKEEKNKTYYLIAIILIVLLMAGSTILYFYSNKKQQDLKTVERQVTLSQQIAKEQQQKLAAFQSSNSVVELNTAIKWAKDQPFNLVYVLQELTKNLPQRGYILEFEMDEKNIIKQSVQFDTTSDAAYYLASISQLPWVDDAVMNDGKSTDVLKNDVSATNQLKTAIDTLHDLNIAPRYVADYEIRLNIPQLNQAIKKQQQKDTENEEGGKTP